MEQKHLAFGRSGAAIIFRCNKPPTRNQIKNLKEEGIMVMRRLDRGEEKKFPKASVRPL